MANRTAERTIGLTGLVGKVFIEVQNTIPRDIQHGASSGTGGGRFSMACVVPLKLTVT
jgi:hypothetical protein